MTTRRAVIQSGVGLYVNHDGQSFSTNTYLIYAAPGKGRVAVKLIRTLKARRLKFPLRMPQHRRQIGGHITTENGNDSAFHAPDVKLYHRVPSQK